MSHDVSYDSGPSTSGAVCGMERKREEEEEEEEEERDREKGENVDTV